jgi:pimeloyl-ACP methyl ester carboxylesterase
LSSIRLARRSRERRPLSAAQTARLSPPYQVPLLRRGPANLVFRPWFDSLAVGMVARVFFPLSRAWAAAIAAEGDVGRFAATLGLPAAQGERYRGAVAAMVQHNARYRTAEDAWSEAFFADVAPPAEELVRRERERQWASHRFMSSRAAFRRLRRSIEPVSWNIASMAEVEARHGARLANPGQADPVPGDVAIAASHRVPGALGAEQWLTYASPSRTMADDAWVHVFEPDARTDPPTVIYLHGIAMEPEMWWPVWDPILGLIPSGVRVFRSEAPWHGHRRLAGSYGGEPVLARAPLGFLDLFEAWVAETALLVAHARETSKGPVAVAGLSLGALVAQRLVSAARNWPAKYVPDALCLVATSADLVGTGVDGDLARAIGVPDRLAAAGWKRPDLEKLSVLLAPQGPPAVDPARIVMVLGTADGVTPYPGGRMLAREWGVPPANVFASWRGHFSAGLDLYRDPRPLARLVEVMKKT